MGRMGQDWARADVPTTTADAAAAALVRKRLRRTDDLPNGLNLLQEHNAPQKQTLPEGLRLEIIGLSNVPKTVGRAASGDTVTAILG